MTSSAKAADRFGLGRFVGVDRAAKDFSFGFNRFLRFLESGRRQKPVKPFKAFSKKAKKSSKTIRTAPALDAGLLAAGQAVEHYEIARYGTPKNWAAQIGLKDASALSDQKAIKEDGCAAQQVGASVGESLSRPIIRSSRGIERISTRRFAT
jgi:hypothetical protein